MKHLVLALLFIPSLLWAAPETWREEWPRTDFSRSAVHDWGDIVSGGPGKDGIPSIDMPRLRRAAQAPLKVREPVVTVELPGHRARAYPVRYLMWHGVVNDVVGDIPIAVTYCPLCNSGMVFDRRVEGEVLSFGVTGKLRHSDMIIYDRQSQSWWQQATGKGLVGTMAGRDLRALPVWMESWAEFRARRPNGLVMAEPLSTRAYSRNPYTGYETAGHPFLFKGDLPPHDIHALERVVRVGDRAWPLNRLAMEQEVSEAGVTITWQAGQASALDTRHVGQGRDVGSIRVRDADGRDVVHDVMFAFAFHAFWPEGRWMLGL